MNFLIKSVLQFQLGADRETQLAAGRLLAGAGLQELLLEDCEIVFSGQVSSPPPAPQLASSTLRRLSLAGTRLPVAAPLLLRWLRLDGLTELDLSLAPGPAGPAPPPLLDTDITAFFHSLAGQLGGSLETLRLDHWQLQLDQPSATINTLKPLLAKLE